ncbi:hypothetical protein B0T10DRAFT_476157 [Thelonectria olida]|uniref:Uncharacterized protein n=1 Tax=Thelonectria olida TaxID=1576542 RepID=A0A9P9AXD6_9HYPO|nr:hypothetical protein B0T10DRAFT_476157 [Thelonectria olida]
MEMFEQHGISRPEGWLSADGSIASDQPVFEQKKVFRVCHACGEALDARQYCSHCGHDSCLKCTSEVTEDGFERAHDAMRQHGHGTIEHSLKRTIHRVETSERNHIHSTEVAVRTVRRQGASKSDSSAETTKPQMQFDELLPEPVPLPPALVALPRPLRRSDEVNAGPTPLAPKKIQTATPVGRHNGYRVAPRAKGDTSIQATKRHKPVTIHSGTVLGVQRVEVPSRQLGSLRIVIQSKLGKLQTRND